MRRFLALNRGSSDLQTGSLAPLLAWPLLLLATAGRLTGFLGATGGWGWLALSAGVLITGRTELDILG